MDITNKQDSKTPIACLHTMTQSLRVSAVWSELTSWSQVMNRSSWCDSRESSCVSTTPTFRSTSSCTRSAAPNSGSACGRWFCRSSNGLWDGTGLFSSTISLFSGLWDCWSWYEWFGIQVNFLMFRKFSVNRMVKKRVEEKLYLYYYENTNRMYFD